MNRQKLSMLLLIMTVLFIGIPVVASNYQPLPGILSPDKVDFGGQTVTLVGGGPSTERQAEAEELFNVKLERLSWNETMVTSRIMAGDSKLDILTVPQRSGYFNMVSSGFLYPVSDLLPPEHYEVLPNVDRYTIDKLQYKDKYYGFGVRHGVHNATMMLMAYNKTIIDRYNQPDPYELWLNGEWTFDAFEKIAAAVTQDTDGDGIIDQFGMTSIMGATPIYRFAPANGVELVRVEEDGTYIFNFDSEAGIEVLNRVLKWNNELGILGGDFTQQTAAFTTGNLTGMRHALAAGVDYNLISYPRGPHTDRYYYPAYEFAIRALPINAEKPEELMALASFLFREEDTYEDLENRINLYMGTEQHYDLYMAAMDQWRGEGDMFQNSGLWEIVKDPIEAVLAGTKGAAAAMDEVRPRAQAFLDDLFGQ